MKDIKRAQIVKFHTPNEDEDPNQLFVVLEVFKDGDRTRAKIEALGTGSEFAPISVVMIKDLIVDKVKTNGLEKYLKTLEL